MLKKLLVSVALLAAVPAFAQSVQQSGTVTRNHIPVWNTSGVISDGGSAADSPISSIGVTNPGGAGICVSSDRQTAAGRNQLCFGASTAGPATISLQNYGTATPQNLQFVINGTPVTIPTGGSSFLQLSGAAISGHLPCFSGTLGLVVDCGTSIGAGTQYGLPYYSTTSSLGSTGAGTNGQFLIGQTSSVPLWASLTGDVGSVTAGGALTLAKVNGIPFASSYTAHGVLIAQGTALFATSTTSNIGSCLISQGLSSDPIWTACASGSGSAGGLNTQVQFNNSTSLAGSANLTWVSPALTIGTAGTTTGQLQLAPAGSGSGTVTIQNPSGTAAYNFNLPTTAGSLGQALLSGGGGSTAMSFGTLGVAAGGTNCTTASGTCLDNITSFGSTGYINRTGGGTYAFATVIPVSGGGTALASGTSGGILGYTASGTLASSVLLTQFGLLVGGGSGATPTAITPGTAGQMLIQQTSANPSWNTMSGDATLAATGALTIASSAVTVAKQANAAAYSIEGNFTAGSTAPQFSTLSALTAKASPAAGDLVLIQDQAASGQLKQATVSSIAAAGSVATIGGNTGAFTLTEPITNATNAILLNATVTPQGRLTLTTGTPVLTSTVSAATTIYYALYSGNLIPIYDGTNFIPTAFTELSIGTTDTSQNPSAIGASKVNDWFVWNQSGTLLLSHGPDWTNDTSRSAGTALVRVNGVLMNSVTIGNGTTTGPAASRGTYIGTTRSDASSKLNYVFGASAAGGTPALFGVWNMYNRRAVSTMVQDSTASWTATAPIIRSADNSVGMRISFVQGQQEDEVTASYEVLAGSASVSNTMSAGIGVNSTAAFSGRVGNVSLAAPQNSMAQGEYTGTFLGFNFLQALEGSASSGTGTFFSTIGSFTQNGLHGRLMM